MPEGPQKAYAHAKPQNLTIASCLEFRRNVRRHQDIRFLKPKPMTLKLSSLKEIAGTVFQTDPQKYGNVQDVPPRVRQIVREF